MQEATTPSENTKSTKKGSWGKFLSILAATLGLIIIIAIIIGGALLASQKWNPKWNPFRHKEVPQTRAMY